MLQSDKSFVPKFSNCQPPLLAADRQITHSFHRENNQNNQNVSHTPSLSAPDSGVNLENVMTDIELRKIELSASNGNGMVKSDKNDSEKEKFIDSDSKIPFDK